jgi:hypothetical protein
MDAPLEVWHDFNLSMLGALAALVGLLIVAMSVNIEAIVKIAHLPARAAAAIATLTLGLVVCALGLIPAQPLWLYGVEVAIGTVILAFFAFHAARAVIDNPGAPRFTRIPKAVSIVVPPLVYAVAAVVLLLGSPAGVYWLAAGAITAVISGVTFAWVVLIEILR